MAQHFRYTDQAQNDRVLVRFTREDLLWRGRLGQVEVPMPLGNGRVLGPTLLDVMQRRTPADQAAGLWTWRAPRDFLEPAGARRNINGHPFKAGLVSGGRALQAEGDFLRVTKISSVSIGAYAVRLAVGTLGSLQEAHAVIGAKAAAAWSADLVRAQALYAALRAADGKLIETAAITALRPAGSVSEAIETDILRDACTALGVDPELNIRRGAGRPRRAVGEHTEAGDFIAVTVVDNTVQAKTIAALQGIPAHTDLSTLSVLKLISLLEVLSQGGAQVDAELLEAYLDAAAPEWRETDSDTREHLTDDPYAILGVSRDMTWEEITRTYRKAMQAMHPDKGACPPWFAQMAAQAYRTLKAQQQPRSDA